MALRVAFAMVAAETAALVVYIGAIAVAAQNSRGSSVTATASEIAVYAVFAALMGWLAWGLWRASPLARTPFLVTQAFAAIIGYTAWSGDGWATKTTGVVLMVIGVVGVVLGLSPALAAALSRE